jgi:putative transcriptional regulator
MSSLDRLMKVKPSGVKLASTRLLLSAPLLNDFFFGRSVIFLLDHDAKGSFGVIVNKPMYISASEFIDNFPVVDFPLYTGGPVNADRIYALHLFAGIIEGSVPIIGNLGWGGNMNQILDLIGKGLINPQNTKFFMGYSGWSKDQLKTEIKQESWIITKIRSTQELIGPCDESFWKEMVLSFGSKYSNWLNFPANPSDN